MTGRGTGALRSLPTAQSRELVWDCEELCPTPALYTGLFTQCGRCLRGGPLLQCACVPRRLYLLAAAGHLPLLLLHLCHLLPLRLAELLPHLPVRPLTMLGLGGRFQGDSCSRMGLGCDGRAAAQAPHGWVAWIHLLNLLLSPLTYPPLLQLPAWVPRGDTIVLSM